MIDQDLVELLLEEYDLTADFEHQFSEVTTGESMKNKKQNEGLEFVVIQKQKSR